MLKLLAGILVITTFGLENIFGFIIYEQNQNQLLDNDGGKYYPFSNYFKNSLGLGQDDEHRRNERTLESAIKLEDENTSSRKHSNPEINISISDLSNITVPLESDKSPLISLLVQIISSKADCGKIPNISLSVSTNSATERAEETLPLATARSARTRRESTVVGVPVDVQEKLYLREEVQKILNEVIFLRGSKKMPASSQEPLDNLKAKLEKLLVDVNSRPNA